MNAQPDSVLTVALVEGLHSAAVRGQTSVVADTIAGLTDATLPGLVEYLCVRHSTVSTLRLPPPPEAIRRTAIGEALARVVCPFGLRTSGRFTPNTSLDPSPAEFFVLRTQAEYLSHDYRMFETRWARAAEIVGLRAAQSAMHLAMSAMTENVVLHAESAVGLLAGYRIAEHAVLFTVADLGRGVLASLRTNPSFVNLQHHRDALRLALQEGVSRLTASSGGFGFRTLFRALAREFGTIRFRTGNVCITMDGQEFGADLGDETYPETVSGFQVTMCCRSGTALESAYPLL